LRHGRMLGGTSVDARQHRERLRWFN
jgi:hypothetical protein